MPDDSPLPRSHREKQPSTACKKYEDNADQRNKIINTSYPRVIWWETKTRPLILKGFCSVEVSLIRSLLPNQKFRNQVVAFQWSEHTEVRTRRWSHIILDLHVHVSRLCLAAQPAGVYVDVFRQGHSKSLTAGCQQGTRFPYKRTDFDPKKTHTCLPWCVLCFSYT